MLFVLISVMLISSGNLEVLPADYIQLVDDIEINEVAPGLYSVTASEFGSSENEILLPQKTVLIPVPPEVDVSVRVIPRNVSSLGAVPEIAKVLMDENKVEYFVNCERSSLNTIWGDLTLTGTFRRAGFVMVQLNPVIVQNGELLAAGSLEVRLDYNRSIPSQTVMGREGEIFQSVFGTNTVWRTPLQSRASSPFWGKPWAEIKVDTAGVFEITADLIPEAIGMPSNSFSMITGRGRNMNFDNPVEDSFVPTAVSVFVDDGNDGTFDSSDRIIFYGRGLAWWGEFQSDHFNGMYDNLNTYWLTWGGAGGPFMELVDGSITGAPSAGNSYVNRLHFENNNVLLAYLIEKIADMFAWHRISAIGSTTANYSFSSPGTTGSGTLRFNCSIEKGANLLFRATVNGSVMSETTLGVGVDQTWEFPVSGLKSSGNSLALFIQDQSLSRSAFVIYSNWIEVFPETGFKSWSAQCQVPLSREQFPADEKRLISWSQTLDSESFVCVTLGDTTSVIVDIPGGKDFEIDLPAGWQEAVMWVLPNGDFREPVSVANSNPGRILGTLSEANTVYLYPEEYTTDMPLFVRGRPSNDALFIGLDEIYNEFNGGVRDPNAVRAFVDYAINTWQQAPTEIVLVGTGYFDPRGFTTAKISLVDVIIYKFYKGLPVCSDFMYSVIDVLPEMAVSRISVNSRAELQLVAQRSLEYSDISQESGIWQSLILGAADDERVPDGGDQPQHTRNTEELFIDFVPDRFVPRRHYLIEYDWNSNWQKPESRVDFIDMWSEGALVAFYVGHGGYDQIAQEGLLFIEDVNLLNCGPRLPYAFFASCDVGVFQNPSYSCMAQKITVAENGGAIVSSGASCVAYSGQNEDYLAEILRHFFTEPNNSIAENQWLGLIDAGFEGNNKPYIIFGDGSLHLALPDAKISTDDPVMRTSELCEIDGSLSDEGLVMLTAWESAVPDSYYTIGSSLLIEYLSTPGEFYRGLAPASPEFSADMFIPSIAQTGDLGRVRYFAPGANGGNLTCSYPVEITAGIVSNDTTGPSIDMWLRGFQGIENPTVSGELFFEADLEDSSGINLLSYPGMQLALYIDDNPIDLAEFFTYKPGSATSGTIVYPLPELQPGNHILKLRAADNVMNLSFEEGTFLYIENTTPEIDQLFVYPTPASSVLSFNWIQSTAGSVSLSIYTVTGRRIISFGNVTSEAGYNQFVWNLLDADEQPVAAGTYVFVISSGDSELTGVATIVR